MIFVFTLIWLAVTMVALGMIDVLNERDDDQGRNRTLFWTIWPISIPCLAFRNIGRYLAKTIYGGSR